MGVRVVPLDICQLARIAAPGIDNENLGPDPVLDAAQVLLVLE